MTSGSAATLPRLLTIEPDVVKIDRGAVTGLARKADRSRRDEQDAKVIVDMGIPFAQGSFGDARRWFGRRVTKNVRAYVTPAQMVHRAALAKCDRKAASFGHEN